MVSPSRPRGNSSNNSLRRRASANAEAPAAPAAPAAPTATMRRSASGRALFDDRIHAGRQLANNLREHAEADVVVLSVSRGGAIVGSVIAESLGHSIPHLYYIVRPIPCPSIPRLSLGSVAGDGSVRIDNVVAKSMGIVCDDATHNVQATELMRMVEDMDLQLRAEQESFWQPAPSAQDLEGKTLLVVDDGMEAGDTMREAIMHLRHCYEASRIIVAVPFCMADLRRQLQRHVESVVDIVSPLFVGSIARWYARGVSASVAEQRLLNRLFVDSATTISSFDYD